MHLLLKIESTFFNGFNEFFGLGLQTFVGYTVYYLTEEGHELDTSLFLGTAVLLAFI